MRDASPDAFTVRILYPDGAPAGIGVLVSERHVLTCAHVVNAALRRNVLTQEPPEETVPVDFPLTGAAEVRRARVEHWAPPPDAGTAGDDIAGLVLDGEGPPPGTESARLAVDPARPGRPVRIFGCPEGRPDGQWVSATIRERVGNGRFQLDSDSALRIQRGFSGSPVFDDAIGRVVGLITMAPRRIQDPDSYAIGAEQLRRVWPELLAGRQRTAEGRHGAGELTILHLSGTRFGAEAKQDLALIADDLTSLAGSHGLRPDLMVVTGDLTEGGRPKEFEFAFEFLGGLAEAAEIPRRHVAVVPGSRDVNLTACRSYFAEQEDCGAQPVPPYFPKWKWFTAAIRSFYGDADMFTPDEPWTLFEMPELCVAVAGLNSTMAESHQEHHGLIGEAQLRWFEQRMRRYLERNWLRLGAVDDGSPRDVWKLDRRLGAAEAVNLLLHGHARETGLNWLPCGLAVLAAGTTAENDPAARYQLITVRQDSFTRYARQYAVGRRDWIGDNRISPDGSAWVSQTDHRLSSTDAAFPAARSGNRAFPPLQPKPRRLATFFELVVEATRARWPDASLTPRPEEAYVRVSRRLPGATEQFPVGVIDVLDADAVDKFVNGVHAEFHAAYPQVPSELVYGGPPASGRLLAHARKHGVTLRSFTEYQGLLDLRPLAERQSDALASDRLYPARLYIKQRYKIAYRGTFREDPKIRTGLVSQVVEWLGTGNARLVMVLGDFGRGKTAFLKQLTRTLPTELPGVLPILVELRGLEKAPTLDRLLVQYLADHGVEDINLGKLDYMISSGRIALLFDGFDELELRVGYDNAADYLRTMLDSVTDRAKVVITSRTQHFISTEQVRTALGKRLEARTTSRVVILEDFTEEQIIEFLAGRYGGSTARARARFELLGEMGNLLDLARNPRMLTFVADLDEHRLRAMLAAGHGRISGADLYREIIDFWLTEETKRQQYPRGLRSLEQDERFAACTALALRMWASADLTIGLGELSAEISATLTGLAERGYSEAFAAHAIGSGSLLVRADDGTFRFVHQSVMEWLVAAAAAAELTAHGRSEILTGRAMSRLMAAFLADLAGHDARRWATATMLSTDAAAAAKQNASRMIVITTGVNLTGVDLRDQDLNGRDLRGANLRGANLRGMHLRRVDLSGADLSDADFREVRMTGGSLRGATLTGSKWDRSALLGTTGTEHAELAAAAIPGRDPAEPMMQPTFTPNTIAFSPDGGFLAVGSGYVIQLIETTDGRAVRVLSGASGLIEDVAFSPDGTGLAAASHDGTARIWDVATGTTRTTLIGHRQVYGVAFSPDSALLATASEDGAVRIWDVATGTTRTTLDGHRQQVYGVAFSPDGIWLATASYDGTARIWDVATGTTRTTLNGHTNGVGAVAFSPDGAQVATASTDRTARIWDLATGTTRTTLTGHTGTVWDVAFSPDGTLVATTSRDGTVRIWDLATCTTRTILTGHKGLVHSGTFSPDSTLLATASEDGTARIWDIATSTASTTLTGRSARGPGVVLRMQAVAFSPDGRLITASGDGTTCIWDVGCAAVRVLNGHIGFPRYVAFSPDVTRIATTSHDSAVQIWDLTTGTTVRVQNGHHAALHGLAFSPDGTLLATAAQDGTASIWDVSTGTTVNELDQEFALYDLAFSPDGTLLAAAAHNGTIRIWDLATGTMGITLTGHKGLVREVAFSPDGTHLATSSRDGTTRIWDTATGTTVRVLKGHNGDVYAVAFSPTGALLATASDDTTARIWDIATGTTARVLHGHSAPLYDVAFSCDGALLATASEDGTARIWDVRTGALVVTLAGNGCAALLPDGRYKLTGDPGDDLWWAIKLCRFAPGELDPYVPGLRRLGADERVLELP